MARRSLLALPLAALAVALLPGVAAAGSYTYFAARDWYVDSAHPTTNYRIANLLRTDAVSTGRNVDSDKSIFMHFGLYKPDSYNPDPDSTFRYIELCMYAETSFLPSKPRPYWAVYHTDPWLFPDDQLTWAHQPPHGATPLFVQEPTRWRGPDWICQRVTGSSDYVKGIFMAANDVMVRPYGVTQAVRWTSLDGSLAQGVGMRYVPWLTVATTSDSGNVYVPG